MRREVRMPKQMSVEIEGFKLFFQQYGIDDLLENIEYVEEVSKSGLSKEQIKEVVLEFYKVMCEDLIMNNNCFTLPDRKVGIIYVKDICDVNNPEYQFDFDTEGIMYQPVINSTYFPNKKRYMTRFVGAMQELFNKEVLTNNHHY